MILTITTNGELLTDDFPDNFLKYCYKQIDCQLVDRIRLTDELDMWIDDEGMFTQAPNLIATLLARRCGYLAQMLYGNAIVCGLHWDDEEGADAGPLSEKDYEYVRFVLGL